MSLSFCFLFFYCVSEVIEINGDEAQAVQAFPSEVGDKEVRCANEGGHLSSIEATNLPHGCCQATVGATNLTPVPDQGRAHALE